MVGEFQNLFYSITRELKALSEYTIEAVIIVGKVAAVVAAAFCQWLIKVNIDAPIYNHPYPLYWPYEDILVHETYYDLPDGVYPFYDGRFAYYTIVNGNTNVHVGNGGGAPWSWDRSYIREFVGDHYWIVDR